MILDGPRDFAALRDAAWKAVEEGIAMINCGHCTKQHETVAEVRDCAKVNSSKEIDLSIPSPPVPTEFLELHRKVMAIFADGKHIRKADIWEGPVPEGFYRLPIQVELEVDVCDLTNGECNALCGVCANGATSGHKVYYRKGESFGGEARCSEHEYAELIRTEYDYVKVQLNQSGTGRYAKRLHTVQELVDGKVEITSATWEYEPGLVNKIRPSHVLTEEQAAEFGKLYGWCCICGRRLTNEESIARGIGPVCAGKQGW